MMSTIHIVILSILVIAMIRTFKDELSGLISMLSVFGIVVGWCVCSLIVLGVCLGILVFGLSVAVPIAIIILAGLLIWYGWDKYRGWKVKRNYARLKQRKQGA